ncbi:MAG: helix-turn-helix domain-containing protein [Nitrososphaerales archaeon]
MLEVRLLVDDPENWIKSVARESGRVKIMDVKAPKPGLTQNFVELTSEKMTPEELLSHLRKSGGVVRSDLSRVDKNRIMGTVTTHDCPVCSTFAGLDCFLVSASTKVEGKMEWNVFMNSNSGLKALCRRLDRNKVDYKILEMTHHMRKRQITSRQEDLVRIAFDLGYFEFPKRINLEHLSAKLGISIGTLSEILRRGEKNILSKYFDSSAR